MRGTAGVLPRIGEHLPRPRLAVQARIGRAVACVIVVALALGAGYLLWFRDSSFVRVEQVSITGARTDEAPRLRAALAAAAREMTTLHLRPAALERAAAAFPTVRSVSASPDFPHRLRIEVVEHRPVALLARGHTPVGEDGTLLHGLRPGRRLPRLDLPPGRSGRIPRAALGPVRVAAAAPPALGARIARVERRGSRGLVAILRRGPLLIFGDGRRSPHKWRAAARVLASPVAAGAAYVDVRLPERPVAGGGAWPDGASQRGAAQGPGPGAPPTASGPPAIGATPGSATLE